MKAAQIKNYGHTEIIQVVDTEKLRPGEGQVLIEVHAAGLNPFDTMLREGYVKDTMPLRFPATLGRDLAGTVAELGSGVSGLAAGDIIYGQGSGSLAEYALSTPSRVAKAPSNLSPVESASLPIVGVSALQALTEHLNLQTGQRLLIQGGAGGIGAIAVQLAKHLGAHVTATAAGPGVGYVKQLGADQIIDYTQPSVESSGAPYDAVFDTVGGDTYQKSLDLLRPGGVIVTMAAQVDQADAKKRGITAVGQFTQVTTSRLNQLTRLVEEGIITPHVAQVFDLDHTVEAFKAREAGKFLGKVIVEIKPT